MFKQKREFSVGSRTSLISAMIFIFVVPIIAYEIQTRIMPIPINTNPSFQARMNLKIDHQAMMSEVRKQARAWINLNQGDLTGARALALRERVVPLEVDTVGEVRRNAEHYLFSYGLTKQCGFVGYGISYIASAYYYWAKTEVYFLHLHTGSEPTWQEFRSGLQGADDAADNQTPRQAMYAVSRGTTRVRTAGAHSFREGQLSEYSRRSAMNGTFEGG